MHKRECVAMILAGGQGSRLGVLTRDLAKPAVPFGGRYRIIDFPLSNCYNSGIYTVGILTQYKPLALHSYIGVGSAWDLDRMNGGVYILPPYARETNAEWYMGTADAIYQNMNLLDELNADNVLILSGDHIYKMNYAKMLREHKAKQADATIAVIDVDLSEASRFGIMNTRADGTIYEFEEKPANPKSTLASMGIYIFKWAELKEALVEDRKNSDSEHDFGKNVIPLMLNKGKVMQSYAFSGYWKDVGTIESYWQANMDLLGENLELNLYDTDWIISSVNPSLPPHFVAKEAKIRNSVLAEGCRIYGTVENSVVFSSVVVEEGAVVKDSVVMSGTVIAKNSKVNRAVLAEYVKTEENEVIGTDDVNSEIVLVAMKKN